MCLIGRDDAALAEILDAPLVKAFLLQVSAELLRSFGYEHPMGEDWRGYQDIDPATLTRERIVEFLGHVDTRDPFWRSCRTARRSRSQTPSRTMWTQACGYPRSWITARMAGLSYSAASADNVREAEDELLDLCGGMR